jgi:hypothetical protein
MRAVFGEAVLNADGNFMLARILVEHGALPDGLWFSHCKAVSMGAPACDPANGVGEGAFQDSDRRAKAVTLIL